MSEEFPCDKCGDVYLSPISATLCAERDEADDRANRCQIRGSSTARRD